MNSDTVFGGGSGSGLWNFTSSNQQISMGSACTLNVTNGSQITG